MGSLPKCSPEPIAIVGSSCRFPGGASSPSKLWKLLEEPYDVLSTITSERFNPDGFYHPNGEYHGSTNVRQSYLLEEDIRVFDHAFFSINPKEAEAMDPQQRLLLETVYEGIESAGYSIQTLQGSQTAVYVGQMTADYYDVLVRDIDSAPQYLATGISRSIMSNRVSYFFDWKGPSVTIDTACSSSLVALHQAVQALRHGECGTSGMAIAAGVNLILGPELYIFESKLHMLSPTGRSRMWDADADGYARGEGLACVVLKTLKQAIADNDNIECVIRETGVNQDGRTTGITMPSVSSQASLIKSTYARAGLDCRKKEDRCQYFEAHGTGTLAGDPVEAEAIRDAFFPQNEDMSQTCDKPLFVGSVKTVIGHLEGTAGLAGVLKASLALQNSAIPPNMHFNRLNPAIEPLYTRLMVPTKLMEWPDVPKGSPRRASVNSFGFGGTNAHVILESWEPRLRQADAQGVTQQNGESSAPYGPITLSANSETALMSAMASLSDMLKINETVDLDDLAWTLQTRRTQFHFRASFSARDRYQLVTKLDEAVAKAMANGSSLGTRAIHVTAQFPPRILAVFTGQGAQWPAMGAELHAKSILFRETIYDLEASLRSLPDAPAWSLETELLAPPDKTRIHDAAISQPLCTALQVALVDLLNAAGISFSAVVGHSSGEIAAAYAAGYVSASDAVRIAYYRGLHAHLAQGPQGQQGKMIAVGMSIDEATHFCQRDQFLGRLSVAASNASSSVTLSGDSDAVDEAKQLLDEEKTFARVLKVDTAYHSHHMQPCVGPYMASLRQCGIQVQPGPYRCMWYSSVHGRTTYNLDSFRDKYWIDNMSQPVLFSQAIFRAVTEEDCHDIALEIGPHPALKGPATESLKTLTGVDIPYEGVMKRGEADFNAFSDGLGFIWRNFLSPYPVVDFVGFRKSCLGESYRRGAVLKDLPPYSWDHDKELWKESRLSKNFRTRQHPVHELLGTAISNGNNREMRWRNVMKINEMEWLRGHQFQGQVLFPAAGYVSMAFEASMLLAPDKSVKLVELQDLIIHHAITIDEDSAGAEVTFVIRVTNQTSSQITAEYKCYSGEVDSKSQDFENMNFTGRVAITLGEPAEETLPNRPAEALPMTPIDLTRLYKSLTGMGLQYSGKFVADTAERRLGAATIGLKRSPPSKLGIHPATLDTSFHSLFAAFGAPGDGRLWTHYLPTSIRHVRINTAYIRKHLDLIDLIADCHLQDASAKTISGDIGIFDATEGHGVIQVHNIVCSSFTVPSEEDDRKLFARNVWKQDISDGFESHEDTAAHATTADLELIDICERASYFYLRRLREEARLEETESMAWHFKCLMDWAVNHLLPKVETGRHSRVKPEWASDTRDMVIAWKKQYAGQIDLEIIVAVGEALPTVVRGDLPLLQVMMENDMLNRLYKYGQGFNYANVHLETAAAQLSHRYPRMNVLEVGAGTGGATVNVLKGLAGQFVSYTYTDISPGFFEKAQLLFEKHSGKMKYKTLDIERDPVEQGYKEHSFDVIVASNVLHATKVLANTLANCRRLLKPGGYLMLLEITSDTLLPQFIMSGLPGWWLGRDDGRKYHPTISEAQWNSVLLNAGFSGVDTVRRDLDEPNKYLCSVMMSQAVDDRISTLRSPLSCADNIPQIPHLLLVGGTTLAVAKAAQSIRNLLHTFAASITLVDSLDDITADLFVPGSAVICLSDLEEPTFKDLTHSRFTGMQTLFHSAKYIIWATQGCRADNPYSNMIVGVGRSILLESPHIRLQFLDIDTLHKPSFDPAIFAQFLLRMVCLDLPEFDNILWSDEHELVIENGFTLVPRILPNREPNDRLNSERRYITKQVNPKDSYVELIDEGSFLILREANRPAGPSSVRIEVKISSLFSFKPSDGPPVFLSVGSIVGSNRKVLVVSSTSRSLLDLPEEHVFNCPEGFDDEKGLGDVLGMLLAESLVKSVQGRLWVHEADEQLARLISHVAKSKGVEVFMSTSTSNSDPIRVYIHPCIMGRDLESLLPADIQTFVNLDVYGADMLPLSSSIEPRKVFASKSGNIKSSIILQFSQQRMYELLQKYCVTAENRAQLFETKTISITETPKVKKEQQLPTSVIDWANTSQLLLPISPINANSLFSGEKTYFLVGLTGEVGQSLCNWMADNGARHLVITSRNPKVDHMFVRLMRRKRVNLQIFSLDVSDRKALIEVHRKICATMPPIAGVANAAMVLRDRSFDNLTLEDFNAVLKPKVDGSKNLDELFYSSNLDFFVLFSSLACVIGNRGQANYGAANMFMTSLACQRRNRGVPASIIDIGMLLGVGYVARSGDQYEAQLRKYNYMAIAEPEFHSMFAEAIVAGLPNSGHHPELITGLERTNLSAKDSRSPWHRNPRFAHYIYEQHDMVENKKHGQSSESVQLQLSAATNNEEALVALETCFSKKLELVLQVPSEKIDKTVPLMKLGIDSLVAVEIRSWFLKELTVDMPVLKMLSGASLTDICKDALARLPQSLRPTKTGDGEPESTLVSNAEIQRDVAIPSLEVPVPEMLTPGNGEAEVASLEGSVVESDGILSTDTARPSSESSYDNVTVEQAYQRVGEMSYAQARLYFLHVYLEDKSTYNVTFAGKVNGPFDILQFKGALRAVADVHESLRSSFFIDRLTGNPMQAVNQEPDISFEHKDLKSKSDVDAELGKLKHLNFDLEHGRSMKVVVLSESRFEHHILFCYHHVILDGISWLLFLRDLNNAYSLRSVKRPQQQAIDFSAKQRRDHVATKIQNELRYWSAEYVSPPAAIPLFPFSKVKSRHVLKAYDTKTFETKLESSLAKRIRRQSSELQVTSFHFYLSALAAFLSRCLGTDDFSIGILDANRTDAEYLEAVGFFLNLLPIRFKLDTSKPFSELTRHTRNKVLAALANSRAPFDTILDHLKVSRSGTENPMFQVALNYRMGDSYHSPLGNCTIEWKAAIPARNPYDLTVDITETADGVTLLGFTTQSYMYSASDSKMLQKWYTHFLEALIDAPSARLSDFSLSNVLDVNRTMELGRGDQMQTDWPNTLAHRIDEVATVHPESPAVKDGSNLSLSYSKMMARTHQIGNHLLKASVKPGSYVATLLEPVVDVVCSLLAIMRLGLIYVPLDLRNPSERLSSIVSDSNPNAIICHDATLRQAQKLAPRGTVIINLSDISLTSSAPVHNIAKAEKPGFALYTSGSTGTPKGVLLTHEGFKNQIFAISKLFGVGCEVVLQQSAFGFDMSLEQIFSALAHGGTVVIVPKDARGDPVRIADLMLSEAVTYTEFVPSEYLSLLTYGSVILKKCTAWRLAFSGGEKITEQLRHGFRELGIPSLQLINVYGPTEVTLSCTRGIVPYDERRTQSDEMETSVGQVLPNYSIVIVDQDLRPLPAGCPGEICIGGAGTAIGYINRPEETAMKFVTGDISEKTFYRSGDKGRILEDGTLHFLGRLDGDSQVKIHGIRIELDEIAAVLLNTAKSALMDAVVSFRPDLDVLVAFIVFAADFVGDKDTFIEQLKSRLPFPPYMCPTFVVSLESLPINPNGKKDRAAIDRLPMPATEAKTAADDEFSVSELQMKKAWEEVLPITLRSFRVDPNSDFFRVGGNSLLLLKLQAALKARFRTDIPLPELFQSSTIRQMALQVQQRPPNGNLSAMAELDWNQEINSFCEGLPAAPQSPRLIPKTGIVVILTGATGFLGTHILQRLVTSPHVKEVHCIAIRPDSSTGASRHVAPALRISGKVTEHGGDLAEYRSLGLPLSDLESLAARAHLIIHNGADVSFLKSYATLRAPNVLATRTLAAIATRHGLPLHFVSSASVAHFSTTIQDSSDGLPEVSVAATLTPPPASATQEAHGYAASKWASEALLERAAATRALCACIHRPTSIVGPGAPATDLMACLLRFSVLLGAVPRFEGSVHGVFDFVAVEDVAADIISAALGSLGSEGNVHNGAAVTQDRLMPVVAAPGVRYVHHCSDVKVLPGGFRAYMEERERCRFVELPLRAWIDRARGAGMSELVAEYLSSAMASGKPITLPVVRRGKERLEVAV